ncbi:DUF393 domain-containing protein [Maribrevibacterium harenarium]|uniref:DUF393 domain-containing protein n=1 Tax=Maribrevibacterium harenarium TaxID=2589817 RepID=A0A501WWL5_9GAMM|nr:DUF393 domain-containing protein [Maribrevibacterium harenarium]TPE51817.1 DUF393 domain-containing protein [Maribrevibacterium harenarium]
MITVFYDSQCPLCVKEMAHLKQYDRHNQVILADIHAPDFAVYYPHIDQQDAYDVLHAETDEGKILLGLDATVAIWQQVNKYAFLKVLRWPVIRLFADFGYRVFARYRVPISLLLTGQRRCASGQCDLPNSNPKEISK